MALARCKQCGSPQGLKRNYPHPHGCVASDIVCGAPLCIADACIWLTDEEERQFVNGQRSFQVSNHARYIDLQ
jgi:hypothetical protein